jgi:hypothetical protein
MTALAIALLGFLAIVVALTMPWRSTASGRWTAYLAPVLCAIGARYWLLAPRCTYAPALDVVAGAAEFLPLMIVSLPVLFGLVILAKRLRVQRAAHIVLCGAPCAAFIFLGLLETSPERHFRRHVMREPPASVRIVREVGMLQEWKAGDAWLFEFELDPRDFTALLARDGFALTRRDSNRPPLWVTYELEGAPKTLETYSTEQMFGPTILATPDHAHAWYFDSWSSGGR